MKKIVYIFIASLLLCTSCEKSEPKLQANEFSDVAFICSQLVNQWSDNIIEVGTPVSFMDLSRNAVSHSWIIEDGCSFLYGKYTENDTEYDSYIIPNAGSETTDLTAFVLFSQPTNSVSVKLKNSFDEEVTYVAFHDDMGVNVTYPFEYEIGSTYNEQSGLWDFEADFQFKVLDKVDATLRLYVGDEQIAEVEKGVFGDDTEAESWENVEITTDDILRVEMDVYGEPDIVTPSLSSYLKSYELISSSSEVISSDPLITRYTYYYFPSAITSFSLGSLKLNRTSSASSEITIPTSSVTKVLPLNINVVMGENDLTASPTVTDFDEITFYLSAMVNTLPDDVVNDFSIMVTNVSKNITDQQMIIKSIELNSTKTAFVVTMESGEDIYVDDEITITYTPQSSDVAITDVFKRPLSGFSLKNIDGDFGFFDPLITDPIIRGFEGDGDEGWYIQHADFWSLSSEQTHSGNYSLKYINDGSIPTTSTNLACQSNAIESTLDGEAGIYKLEAWVYIEGTNSFTSDISLVFQFPTQASTVSTTTILDSELVPHNWYKIERTYTFAEDLVSGVSKLNIQMNSANFGTLYIDDISISRVQTRP